MIFISHTPNICPVRLSYEPKMKATCEITLPSRDKPIYQLITGFFEGGVSHGVRIRITKTVEQKENEGRNHFAHVHKSCIHLIMSHL